MTAWQPAEPGPIVLRPKKGKAELVVGTGEVRLRDERGQRAYPRQTGPAGPPVPGAPGAAVRAPVVALRGRYESTPATEGVHRIEAVEVVGDRGQPLDGLPWSGADAAALERAAASVGLPLEWAPAGGMAPAQPVPAQAQVLLRRPVRRGAEWTPRRPARRVPLNRRRGLDGAG